MIFAPPLILSNSGPPRCPSCGSTGRRTVCRKCGHEFDDKPFSKGFVFGLIFALLFGVWTLVTITDWISDVQLAKWHNATWPNDPPKHVPTFVDEIKAQYNFATNLKLW